jgi:hypothetical protein
MTVNGTCVQHKLPDRAGGAGGIPWRIPVARPATQEVRVQSPAPDRVEGGLCTGRGDPNSSLPPGWTGGTSWGVDRIGGFQSQ